MNTQNWHPPHGVKPIKKDHRDYSFQRTFGAIAGAPLPESLNLSAGLPPRSQNADGFPYGCTGYTQAAICGDEDRIAYDPQYTYDRTLEMMFYRKDSPYWEKVGCDLKTSLKSTIVYGVDAKNGSDPLIHRRGAYYAVEPIAGDWFESLRQTMMINKRPISAATAWFSEFGLTFNRIVTTPKDYDLKRATYHNWEIVGWETVDGVPYILFDAWYGYGLSLMPREVINQLFTLSGSGAFTLAPFTGDNVVTVKLTIYELVASYLRRILDILTK